MPVTQFNMKYVEPAGLVKFDFLGLKTLTVLTSAARRLIAAGAASTSILPRHAARRPEDLRAAAAGDTVGVFQLESGGMRDALRKLRPTASRTSSRSSRSTARARWTTSRLHRPQARRRAADYLHPMLEPILKETYGVIIYQEQVMQIAQDLAGYSSARPICCAAPWARRSRPRWTRSASASSRARSSERRRPRPAEYIFDLVDKFAGYGFNKSHAAAYALVAYQTAYLKANYPGRVLRRGSMTLDMGNTDKLRRRALDRVRRQGARAPRGRHRCRHRAVRPRAQGQDR
jgi:DNA polymerase III subunit alpha